MGEHLMGTGALARRLGVYPETVAKWRKIGLFPEPDAMVNGRRMWAWDPVKRWAEETGRSRATEAPERYWCHEYRCQEHNPRPAWPRDNGDDE